MTNIEEFLKYKTSIPRKKLVDTSIALDELISFAKTAKPLAKATCNDAIEYATKINPSISEDFKFEFVVKHRSTNNPRVKWESTKVIGNIVHYHKNNLELAIKKLLENINHEETVMRWSTAFALRKILKLNTKHNAKLQAETIRNEEKIASRIFTQKQ